MVHQCRARWIVGNCPVWLVRAYSSINSVRTRFHSWEGLSGLAVPSPHALSYHALYRAIRVVVLLPNPALLRSSTERRYATVSFCRTTFEFIFSQRHFSDFTLPLLAACLVSSRACRPWTLVPSPFPCVLSLCCYVSFYFFLLFIFDFYYHYHRQPSSSPLRLRLLLHALFFLSLFLFISSQSSLPSQPSSISDKLKK